MNTSRSKNVATDLGNLIRTVRSGEAMAGAPANVDAAPLKAEQPDESPVGDLTVGESVTEIPQAAANTNSASTERQDIQAQKPSSLQSAKLRQGPRARAAAPTQTKQRVERSSGRRSDPGYQKVGVYVQSDTILAVKQMLLTTGRDMSELVDELLAQWLQHRTRSRSDAPVTSLGVGR
jgi:hypothetical protein